MASNYNLTAMLKTPEKDSLDAVKEEPLLLKAAKLYLRSAGIEIPYAELEMRDDAVILHGAPNCDNILVCARGEKGIQSFL
ncbi:MAG: hypothetical protein KAK00_11035 [Nanoarchaeota archaeon]|nr:hypothetical protein [Nanoarchaeota archaeon]